MSDAVAMESRDVVLELHRLFTELDRGRLREDALRAMRARLGAVRSKLDGLVQKRVSSPLGSELVALDQLLGAHTPERDVRAEWLALRQRVQPTYESLVQLLSAEDIHVPSLRPTNYGRNVLHLASATAGLLVLGLAPDWGVWIAGFFAVSAWSMEILRKFFPIVTKIGLVLLFGTNHPHELYRVNSATWYSTALLLLALTHAIVPASIALIVLGVGDPLAAIIGRRFGRIPLVHGRSLEGSLTFVGSGALVAGGFVLALHPEVSVVSALLAAFAGALAGGVAELVSRRVDDNFSVPLAAFAAAYGALALGL